MNREQHLADALRWIAALPLLGDAPLARLIAAHDSDARWTRQELERRGWIDWIAPRSAGTHPPHLAYVREQALPALAERCGLPVQRLRRHLPVGTAALLRRLGRVESILVVNDAVARLAADVRRAGGFLADAVSFPLRTAGTAGRWWPLEAAVWVTIEIGGGRYVTCMAWDRAGATDAARAARARAWLAPDTGAIERAAGVLLVCADEGQRRTWDRLLTRGSADGAERRPIALTTASEVMRYGLLEAAWHTPGMGEHGLLDWMHAGEPAPGARYRRRIGSGAVTHIPRTRTSLRVMLRTAPAHARRGPGVQLAALACELAPQERLLLEWIGRHLWLTQTQLAILLDEEGDAVARRLDVLARHGAARSIALEALGEPAWIVTPLGQRHLALVEHDQPRRQQRLGAVVVPDADEDAPDGVARPRILLHELGVNAAVVALAVGARRDGGRLADWRNVGESAHSFDFHGRPSWIRPDASGVVVSGSSETPFLLEYDRGSEDDEEITRKLVGYDRYYAVGAWEEDFPSVPTLIFVCADYGSFRRMKRVAAGAPSVPIVVLPESGTW